MKEESCCAAVSIAKVVASARGVLECKYETPAASHSQFLGLPQGLTSENDTENPVVIICRRSKDIYHNM